jgi:hypothetical protein
VASSFACHLWKIKNNEVAAAQNLNCKVSSQIIKYKSWVLKFENLKSNLSKAGLITDKLHAPTIIEIPTPEGLLIKFEIYQSQTMSAELAKQFPELQSYMGNALHDKSITIRANINETGFHGLITSTKGQWLVEPYCTDKSKDYYCCYWKSNFISNREPFNEKQ